MIKVNVIKPFEKLDKYESWKRGWKDQDEVDIFSYVSDMCSPEDMLLFCRVLFPDFVIFRGGIFLSRSFDVSVFNSWFEKLDGNMTSVERLMNHTHLYDLFSGCLEDVSDAIFLQLAEVLAVSWRLVLKDKFAEVDFSVNVTCSDRDYGPVVTFYQG
jgi:hypothetical protein